jgi:hypothetical protein
MKKSKLLIIALCISGLCQVHFIKAPGFDIARSESNEPKEGIDDTTQRPPKGFFNRVVNFFKPKSGKTGSDSGSTGTVATGKGEVNGTKGTEISIDTPGEFNNGDLTSEQLDRLRQSGRRLSFDVRSEKKEMTLEEKRKRVDETGLSPTEKAIVKSFVGRTDNVELLITGMEGLKQEIVTTMTGVKGNVRSDVNQDVSFVDDLQLMRTSLEFRIKKSNEREVNELKLMIVDGLLNPINKTVRNNFFSNDIEPSLRPTKDSLRTKKR